MSGNPCHYIHIFYSLAVANVGLWMGLALGGSLAGDLGLRWTFTITAARSLLSLPILTAIFTPARSGKQAASAS